ncbi:MAG: hypothetical protein VKI63_08145 [Cyanobium sp.]|jgi:hypothetical protein|nr:hypothetical protein [Cyanobium sp.]
MSGSGLPPLRPPGPDRLRGGRIVLTGLIAGLVSLLLARFLTMIVASTPTRLSAAALFWLTALLSAAGSVAGMALEAVRQLQAASPEHADQRNARRHRRPGGGVG